MKFSRLVLPCVAVAALAGCSATTPHLKSSVSRGMAGIEARVPYTNYTNYFGYIDSSVKPDGKYKNKDAYYLYVWVPAAVDEIGVSMISPSTSAPSDSDFVHSNFNVGMKNDASKFFDTYLLLDRLNIVDSAKIKNGGKVLQNLGRDDDSSELPANPKGLHFNSLLRKVSSMTNPSEALVRGVYRISFTSFRSSIEGSFEATVGTNVPGVKIAPSLTELHNLVNAN
ncbi:Lipl32 family lipoprotein [Marinomonas mediterranea]|jgi:Surface lipoprotein of Spirochaetales order.|uniref:Major outer membrane protein (MOMP), LipL32 lipoprotein n=1 Tax=Marinomonas mediterranea (strain ATCC 700492 / JCM 21426 / NBRC 103028 / MMB-1) TaxID=717774 RepID=F2JX58_MARM1|nr:Lipl32 family lipoprotein [Marinomonas mediterranea]ADZ89577.1 major outer membrane protein (MOMP), LipL32 lipoprotein [Marinomonas mediterranea MMB-1]WCN15819.1 hypothetical protein GV053_01380 [Marinomonas mediterranea MMB-1]